MTEATRAGDGESRLTHPKYRPDIDGLRAVAVLSVVAFHAFPDIVSGGFIGVDIFFVISGFLISTILFENLRRGTFSFAEFYRRRIRRIFPALIVVLIATMVLGWALLLNDEFRQLSRHVVAGAAFLSNFALWQESGYFDSQAELKPLLHLWSLGVEEQFYIVWPLLAYVGWKLRRGALALLILIAAASFALNIAGRHADPVGMFYSPLTRFWELLIGAVLAHLSLRRATLLGDQPRWADAASVVGTVLIVVACALLTTTMSFPGWWAAIPVAGAALLIAVGPNALINHAILRQPPLVWVGLISYPLYLWHWPLLSFLRIAVGEAGWKARMFVVCIAFVLAWLVYRYIEAPIRQQRYRRLGSAPLLVLGMVAILSLGIGGYFQAVVPRLNYPHLNYVFTPNDAWAYISERGESVAGQTGTYLIRGTEPEVALLIGDSHVAQYGPRLGRLLESGAVGTRHVIFAVSAGCPPIPDVFDDYPGRHTSCPRNRANGFALMDREDVDTILVGGAWNQYFLSETVFPKPRPTSSEFYVLRGRKEYFRGGSGRALALENLKDLLASAKASGKRVFLLLDNPSGREYDPRSFLLNNRYSTLRLTDASYRTQISIDQLRLNEELTALAQEVGVGVIDPSATLCRAGICDRLTAEGAPVYRDQTHLSEGWIRANASFLDPVFVK